jgi:hypothetical protein
MFEKRKANGKKGHAMQPFLSQSAICTPDVSSMGFIIWTSVTFKELQSVSQNMANVMIIFFSNFVSM